MCFRRWRLFQKHSICLTQTNDTRHSIYLTRRLPNSWWHCTWLRCRSSWPNGSSSWLSSQGDEWLRINEDGRLKWSAKKFDTKGDPMERMFPKLKLFLFAIEHQTQRNISIREGNANGNKSSPWKGTVNSQRWMHTNTLIIRLDNHRRDSKRKQTNLFECCIMHVELWKHEQHWF